MILSKEDLAARKRYTDLEQRLYNALEMVHVTYGSLGGVVIEDLADQLTQELYDAELREEE